MLVQLPFKLDPGIKKNILDFVSSSDASYWVNNTLNRKYCILNRYNLPLTFLLKEYSSNIFSQLNITKQTEEEIFGNFIGVHNENGFVLSHIDSKNIYGWEHVRINFLVNKPKEGGMPIINNELFKIEEDCSWLNLASKWKHTSTPVVGDTLRIVLSLGAFVSPAELHEAKIY